MDDPNETVVELKNKLNFVKVEHQLVLKALHVEIEDLKRKNKGAKIASKFQWLSVGFKTVHGMSMQS